MTFSLTGWMLYTMWAVFGLMLLDFLIGLFRSLKTLSPTLILDYLKDILYYVLPLMVIANMMPLDPTGWVLLIGYYVSGLAVIWNYLIAIKNKF
ncbi:hypothetical protein [Ammoniphilus sp. 3BR4]|uniref:hypothetical protein n=1 Tax=Ammoniphilus sp. 3BR4 TaxID=3158265 RepID=UPI003465377A